MKAVAVNDIKAIDWNDNEVVVAKAGDTVKVLQEFPTMVFIECENWEFEVITNPKNIKVV